MFSLLAIVAIVAVAGVGSYAGWSDTDNSEDNVITAGSLELEWSVDGGLTWTKEAPTVPAIGGVAPGNTGTYTILVKNSGKTVDGNFEIENVSFVDADADGVSTGQLSEFIKMQMQMTQNGGATAGNVKELPSATFWDFGHDVTLTAAGEGHIITVNWEFVDVDPGFDGATDINDTMGDSVFINFSGVLTQI